MKSIHRWFDEYGESHRNPVNKKIHFVCVPLIYFSIVGLLSSIPHNFTHSFNIGINNFFISYAALSLVLVMIFYLRLSVKIFLGMLIFSIAVIFLNFLVFENSNSLTISILIFVAAWIGQFYGHKVEGKKPSFFKDVQFLLIGPAWILSFVYKKIGVKY